MKASMARPRGRPRKLAEDHRVFTLRLPADLHRELRALAGARATSLNDLVLGVLAAWWGEHPDRQLIRRLTSTRRGPRK